MKKMKKFSKKIINQLRHKLFRKHIALNNKVKLAIQFYFGEYMDPEPISISIFGISKIYAEKENEKIYITIHLSHPGVFIGRSGSNIEGLKKFLTEQLEFPVYISLTEHDAFKCDYSF